MMMICYILLVCIVLCGIYRENIALFIYGMFNICYELYCPSSVYCLSGLCVSTLIFSLVIYIRASAWMIGLCFSGVVLSGVTLVYWNSYFSMHTINLSFLTLHALILSGGLYYKVFQEVKCE
jgi:hypothetical protein